MKKTNRPVIIPTALTSAGLLWSGLLVVYFLALLFVYLMWCRLEDEKARLAAPVETPVTTQLLSTVVPAGWARYEVVGDHVCMHKNPDTPYPGFVLTAIRNPHFAYRAHDLNPPLMALEIADALGDEDDLGEMRHEVPRVLSSRAIAVKPGIQATEGFFRYGQVSGWATFFYLGDIRYSFLGIWHNDDPGDDAQHAAEFAKLLARIRLPQAEERFRRPMVDSSLFATDDHARILGEVARERALWTLYADRVRTEPDVALKSAIEHFRRMLERLSSVREERQCLESEEFMRYEEFLVRRQAVVKGWLVQMEKLHAIGDREGALKQAEFITRQATLEDESQARRQAALLEATLRRELQAQN